MVETKTNHSGWYGQRLRSEAERKLPVDIRDAMDRARSLIDPRTNKPCTPEWAAAFVNNFLPPGDPGRM